MTKFQLAALAIFGVIGCATYWSKIQQFATSVVNFVLQKTSASHSATPKSLVTNMMFIAELRDQLAVAGCQEGADACTALLRVMVEYKYPQG